MTAGDGDPPASSFICNRGTRTRMDPRHIQVGIGLVLLYCAVLVGGLYAGLLEPRAAVVVSTGSSIILIMMGGVLSRLLLHGEL